MQESKFLIYKYFKSFLRLKRKTYIPYQPFIYSTKNQMKKINKKYADLLHQASIATGRKEAVGLLHKAAKLQTKFDEKSKLHNS